MKGFLARLTSLLHSVPASRADRYRELVENTGDILFETDRLGIYTYCSPSVTQVLGYLPSELLGCSLFALVPEEEAGRLTAQLGAILEEGRSFALLDYTVRRKDGSHVYLECSGQPILREDGGVAGYRGVARDITQRRQLVDELEDERRKAEEVLKHQALHDALTGLPNRTLLRDRISHAIAEAKRDQGMLALLVMDLDRFKEVNDTFGHPWGDVLLQQVTLRVLGVIRECDTVARLGGDEFALVLQGITMEQDAIAVAARILTVLSQPFAIENHEVQVGLSIGIALFPEHAGDPDSLLRLADVAMYVAKRGDGGYAVYSPEHDQNNPSRTALLRDLRRALEQDELCLYYQPKVSIGSGHLMGAEALVRWPHPERGLLLPSDFISLVEQAGLMASLGLWALRRALLDCRDWTRRGLELPVAVNLAAQNMRDLRLPQFIACLLEETGLPATSLQIEITENAIMSEHHDTLEVLSQLREMGIRISIDDFGTGYSSLVYLKRLPVDEIKIDRSFVSGMVDDENDAAIVRSTIDLGHNLGLEVVAEGVEDDHTWTFLDDLGCDIAQGYCISRPMPPSDLPGWARKWLRVARKRFVKAATVGASPADEGFWGVA